MQHTRSGQLKWDGTAKLTPSGFDADQPAAFYLLDNREGMEALADATLVVQGVELPVHSQVTGRWLAPGGWRQGCVPLPGQLQQHCGQNSGVLKCNPAANNCRILPPPLPRRC